MRLSKQDISTLKHARWPEDGQLYEASASKLCRGGLAFDIGGKLFITEDGKRKLDQILRAEEDTV